MRAKAGGAQQRGCRPTALSFPTSAISRFTRATAIDFPGGISVGNEVFENRTAMHLLVHFFVSDRLVRRRPNGSSTALPPVNKSAANPLLREGLAPYDMAWWNTYPSIAHTNGTWQLWYNGFASCPGNVASRMCPSTDYPNRTHVPHVDRSVDATFYAESHDGLAFRRPALGQVPWPSRGTPRCRR